MPVSTECAAALLSFRYPSLNLVLTGQTWLISSWPWNLFEKHVFPLSFSLLCLDITKLWRSKSYFCRTESCIIEGDFALPLISCVLCCYRCFLCTSGFCVGPLAVFFVHFPLRWYREISWSILSLLCWWYTAIFIFWNVVAWGFVNMYICPWRLC